MCISDFFVCLFLHVAGVNIICSFISLYMSSVFYYREGIKDLKCMIVKICFLEG